MGTRVGVGTGLWRDWGKPGQGSGEPVLAILLGMKSVHAIALSTGHARVGMKGDRGRGDEGRPRVGRFIHKMFHRQYPQRWTSWGKRDEWCLEVQCDVRVESCTSDFDQQGQILRGWDLMRLVRSVT